MTHAKWLLATLLCCASLPVAAQDPDEIYALFDVAGIRKSLKGPLIQTGGWKKGKRVAQHPLAGVGTGVGVLIEKKGRYLTWFDMDQGERRRDEDVPYWKLDLARTLQSEYDRLVREAAKRKAEGSYIGAPYFDPALWATYSSLHGQQGTAERFLAFAQQESGDKPLATQLREDFAWAEFSDILDGGVMQGNLSWPAAKTKLQAFLKKYPKTFHSGNARSYLAAIGRMEIQKRPANRIAGLIYNFRTERVPEDRDHSKSEAALIQLGVKAMPQLIAALNDEALTPRSADGERMMSEYHVQPLLRAGDVAARIIGEIAHLEMHPRPSYSAYSPLAVRNAGVRRQVATWWAEYQEKGEKQILVEKILRGEDNSDLAFNALAKKDPAAAVSALRKVYESKPEMLPTAPDVLRSVHTPAARQLAKDFLRSKQPYVRYNAANVVLEFDPVYAGKLFIAEWKATNGEEHEDEQFQLLRIMLRSRSPEAIQALRAGLKQRPRKVRSDVTTTAEYELPGIRDSARAKPLATDSRYWAELEGLLVDLLTDKEMSDLWGFEFGGNGKQLRDARISDFAALALHRLNPKRYPFKILPTMRDMDALEAKFRETWAATRK